MATDFELNPVTGKLDLVVAAETFAHADLTDMPDTLGTNSDHDARYLTLDQTTPQTFTNLGSGTGLMKVTAGLLGLDTATYLTAETDPLSLHLDQTTPQAITATDVTITASDEIYYGDATDSGKFKKDTVQGIIDLVSAPFERADGIITPVELNDTLQVTGVVNEADDITGTVDLWELEEGTDCYSTPNYDAKRFKARIYGYDDVYEIYSSNYLETAWADFPPYYYYSYYRYYEWVRFKLNITTNYDKFKVHIIEEDGAEYWFFSETDEMILGDDYEENVDPSDDVMDIIDFEKDYNAEFNGIKINKLKALTPNSPVDNTIELDADTKLSHLRLAGGILADGTVNGFDIPTTFSDARFMWIPSKAALRAGAMTGGESWIEANIGTQSVAFGNEVIASGTNSIAMGTYNNVTGNWSFAAGVGNQVSGAYSQAFGICNTVNTDGAASTYSQAFGNSNLVSGQNAAAFGRSNINDCASMVVFGQYSAATGGSKTNWVDTDPVFVIGNGTGTGSRSNMLTIYKNGNFKTTGIITIDSDSSYIILGDGQDGKLIHNGSGVILQSDVTTATDYLQLRGGTNGIDFNIGATEQITLTDGVLNPTTDSDVDLGTSSLYFKNAFIDQVNTPEVKTNVTSATDLTITTGAAKTLVLGTSVYNDANVGGMALRGGATAPPVTQWVDKDGNNTGIYGLGFAVNDEANGAIEIPHDYKEGTNLSFHIHWGANAAPSGTDYVKWTLTYCVCRAEVVTPNATATSIETAYDTQYEHKFSVFSDITGTNFKIGDQVIFNIKRVTAAGDAYAGVAIAETIGFHYECDTLGSRQIAAK